MTYTNHTTPFPVKCNNCGSIIHPTVRQQQLLNNLFSNYWELNSTGMKYKFTRLKLFDKMSKCCEHTDYDYIK